MQDLESLFNKYSADHQNELNQKIHLICVPLIVYSIMGLLWTLPKPNLLGLNLNWSIAFASLISIYYFFLSFRLSLIMVLSVTAFFVSFHFIETHGLPLLETSVLIFILAWIGQFYGHKVEGRKPSFFTDLTYLFIGPLWVVEKILRKKTK